MAIKEKSTKTMLDKKSKIIEILTTEYKWETYLLGFLSLVAIALGLLLFTGTLAIAEATPIIGGNSMLFAWIITIVGVIGLGLFAVPFFRPAVPELGKLSWPSFRVFVANLTRVFIFILIMIGILLLYEAFIQAGLAKVLK